MSIAVQEGIHFTLDQGEGTGVPVAQTFAGLDDAEQVILARWLHRVGTRISLERGINLAIDLSARPWNIAGVSVVIGVFEAGKDQASWLIVRAAGRWVLAQCSDGFVSDEMPSLQAVLDIIAPA